MNSVQQAAAAYQSHRGAVPHCYEHTVSDSATRQCLPGSSSLQGLRGQSMLARCVQLPKQKEKLLNLVLNGTTSSCIECIE